MIMNDFLQAFRFGPARRPAGPGPVMPEWLQRGLMRSFGEDDLPAVRPGPSPADRVNRKSKTKNRK